MKLKNFILISLCSLFILSCAGGPSSILFDPLEKYENAGFSVKKICGANKFLSWKDNDTILLYDSLERDMYEYNFSEKFKNMFDFVDSSQDARIAIYRENNSQLITGSPFHDIVCVYDIPSETKVQTLTNSFTNLYAFTTNLTRAYLPEIVLEQVGSDDDGYYNKYYETLVIEYEDGETNSLEFSDGIYTGTVTFYEFKTYSKPITGNNLYVSTFKTGKLVKIDLSDGSTNYIPLSGNTFVNYIGSVSPKGKYAIIHIGDKYKLYANGFAIVNTETGEVTPLYKASKKLDIEGYSPYLVEEYGGFISPDLTKVAFLTGGTHESYGETTSGRTPESINRKIWYIDISSLNLTE
jgi:hypothetical protein